MGRRQKKTFLMQLIERDHPGKSIEELMIDTYAKHGTERAAAQALGVTQQSFNTWKFRLDVEQAMFERRAQLLEAEDAKDQV